MVNAAEPSPHPWSSISPVLDDVMGALSESDRTALIEVRVEAYVFG